MCTSSRQQSSVHTASHLDILSLCTTYKSLVTTREQTYETKVLFLETLEKASNNDQAVCQYKTQYFLKNYFFIVVCCYLPTFNVLCHVVVVLFAVAP